MSLGRWPAASALALVCIVAAGCGWSGRDSTTGTSTVGPSNTTNAGAARGGLFTASEPWTTDVFSTEKSDRSDAIIAALNDAGGWGNDNKLQTDFAITVFEADESSPRVQVVANPDEILLRRAGLRRGARRDAGSEGRRRRGFRGPLL